MKTARVSLRLSQIELADLLDIPVEELAALEIARIRLSAALMFRLCQALDIKVSYLYTGLEIRSCAASTNYCLCRRGTAEV